LQKSPVKIGLFAEEAAEFREPVEKGVEYKVN